MPTNNIIVLDSYFNRCHLSLLIGCATEVNGHSCDKCCCSCVIEWVGRGNDK